MGDLPATRGTLQRVATHIVARSRFETTGRFGLRVTPGGFGTPEHGDGPRRVRVAAGLLVVEDGAAGAARTQVAPIAGATLDELAGVAGVDLSRPLSVGADTPPLGSTTEPLQLDRSAAELVGRWFDVTARALDAVLADAAAPAMVQLWPEHFDVAVDVAFDPARTAEQRVNLGGSAGDEHHDEPYLYVGPWTPERPGESSFWNAPFGAVLGHEEVLAASRPVAAALAFFRRGLSLLAPDR